MIHVVNMIPFSLSGESSQDSEPNLAVNPAKPTDMVGTAFTRAPMGGSFAPIYVSTDGGNTWSLRTVVPGNGSFGTADITVGFATTSGVLYAGTLNGTTLHLQILRTASFTSTTPMTVLVDRANEDQPWVVAGSVVVGKALEGPCLRRQQRLQPAERPYRDRRSLARREDRGRPRRIRTALGRATGDDRSGRPSDPRRAPRRRDGLRRPRALGERRRSRTSPWTSSSRATTTGARAPIRSARSSTPATARSASASSRAGSSSFERHHGAGAPRRRPLDRGRPHELEHRLHRVVRSRRRRRPARTGRSTSAARPTAARPGRTTSARSRTRRTRASPWTRKAGSGLVYQRFTGSRWVTQLELTTNAWSTAATVVVLHTAPSATPARTFLPYLGDYIRLLAVGDGLPRGLLWEQHPRQRELPERGRLPTGGELHDAHAVPHGRRDAGRPVDRPVLLPLDGQADHPQPGDRADHCHHSRPAPDDRAGDPDQADLARADHLADRTEARRRPGSVESGPLR